MVTLQIDVQGGLRLKVLVSDPGGQTPPSSQGPPPVNPPLERGGVLRPPCWVPGGPSGRMQGECRENAEKLIYIQHNSHALRKFTAVDYEPLVIEWTEGTEDNAGWVDAWQGAEQAANEALNNPAEQQARARRGAARAERVARMAGSRHAPMPDSQVPAGQIVGETRLGRTVRRPPMLNL